MNWRTRCEAILSGSLWTIEMIDCEQVMKSGNILQATFK
jgi:hypothetical protein